MVPFDLWRESFLFGISYSIIIIIPCIIVGLLGRKMLDQLGRFPSKTPTIQMSVLFYLIITEVITFAALIGFYYIFAE